MSGIPTGAELRRRLGLLRPAYRARELLRELGLPWSHGRLIRTLRDGGVCMRGGLIWMSDVQERMPHFWRSVLLIRGVHEPVAEILEKLALDLVQEKEDEDNRGD